MPHFTKFSVWEDDLSKLILEFKKHVIINDDEIRNWFYTDGIICFIETQSEFYNKDLDICINREPFLVTDAYFLGLKTFAFERMGEAFVKEFSSKERIIHTSADILEKIYSSFAWHALTKHNDFYALQVKITNKANEIYYYHHLCELKGQMPKLLKNLYLVERNSSNPQLCKDIDAQILLIDEYVQYLKLQSREIEPLQATVAAFTIFSASNKYPLSSSKENEIRSEIRKVCGRNG